MPNTATKPEVTFDRNNCKVTAHYRNATDTDGNNYVARAGWVVQSLVDGYALYEHQCVFTDWNAAEGYVDQLFFAKETVKPNFHFVGSSR